MNSMSIDDVIDVLADFIDPIAGRCEQAQVNRVAMDTGAFCMLTPLFFKRLSTTREVPNDTGSTATSSVRLTEVRQADIQVDIYGVRAADRAIALETVFRSGHAYDLIKARDKRVAPLYASEAMQAPFINAGEQWEQRYTVTLSLQVHITVEVPQAYFDRISVTTEQVDT